MDFSKLSPRQVLIRGGGVFALFALLATALSVGSIRADAERRAGEILLLEGFGWAHVEAYGRGMAVKGTPPSAEAGAAAVAAVAADWSVRRAWGDFDGMAGGESK